MGFSDGESNFTIGFDQRCKSKRFNFRFMIGLHIDDKAVLMYIREKLGCGNIRLYKKAAYFIITNPYHFIDILFPIFDNFNLNTTKYLDYLSFKEALFLYLSLNKNNMDKDNVLNLILDLKNKMNSNRTEFTMPTHHIIKITSY